MRKLVVLLLIALLSVLAYQFLLQPNYISGIESSKDRYPKKSHPHFEDKKPSSDRSGNVTVNMALSGVKIEHGDQKSDQYLSSDELLKESKSNVKSFDVEEERQYSDESLTNHLKAVDLSDVMSRYIRDNKEVILNMKQDCVREKSSGHCVLTPNDMTDQENERWKAETAVLVRSLISEFINGKNITLEAIYCDLKICEVLIAFDFGVDGSVTYDDNHQEFSRMVYFINQHPSLNILYERTDLHPMGNPSSQSDDIYYRYFVLLLED